MDDAPVVPVLGMVGGGQLARMTHQAVVGLGIDLRILAEPDAASARSVAAGATVGSWDELDDLLGFAAGCDVVTFDHELTDPAHLVALEDGRRALRAGQGPPADGPRGRRVPRARARGRPRRGGTRRVR